MCLGMHVDSKKLPMIKFGFPKGWNFVFDEQVVAVSSRGKGKSLNGLVILAPNGRKYYFAHSAICHNPMALADADEDGFCRHVGLDKPRRGTRDEKKRANKENTRSVPQQSNKLAPQMLPSTKCQKNAAGITPQLSASLADLYDSRCTDGTLYKKALPAPALPIGWRFYFADPGDVPWKLGDVPEGLEGLVLLSPEGEKFATVHKAYKALSVGAEVTSMAKAFYANIGCNVMEHPLRGKQFCKRWVDGDGKYQVVYGKIVQVLLSKDEKNFTVEFDPISRDLVNKTLSSHRGVVPDRHQICERFAYGGCLLAGSVPPTDSLYWTWLVPECRHQSMEKGDKDNFLPKVVVDFRGYRLTMQPKESTIPNAGYGVFLSCESMVGAREDFKLAPGELLDLGVYAPFRADDLKLKHVFDLKNFLFNYICGEWSFDTVEGDKKLFDITDDATGELHNIAKKHICAYFNETDGESIPSISAAHDPAGCVHYMLGHLFKEHGELVLKADGVSREVFIDYGATYEDFRIRKDYSRLQKKDAEERKKVMLETDDGHEMTTLLSLNLQEITQCLSFLEFKWYEAEREYPVSVISRGIIALMLLRKRMDALIAETALDPLRRGDKSKGPGPRGKIQQQRSKSNKLLNNLFGWWNDCHALKDTFLSDLALKKAMEFVLDCDNLVAMDPEELGNNIKGTETVGDYIYS
ncbi:MAG: hypothetical protein SGILL_006029 [Bacillariaceae sp.]